jgi:hypothetical protein
MAAGRYDSIAERARTIKQAVERVVRPATPPAATDPTRG